MNAVVVAGPAFVRAGSDIDFVDFGEDAPAAAGVTGDEFRGEGLSDGSESSRPIRLDLAILNGLLARPDEVEPMSLKMKDDLSHVSNSISFPRSRREIWI